MADTIQLTAEQTKYILSLPKRTVVVGGVEQILACDLEKKMAFFLDGNGRPTGRASKLSDATISNLRAAQSAPPPKEADDPDIVNPKIKKPTSALAEKKSKGGGLGDRLRKLAGASDAEIEKSRAAPSQDSPGVEDDDTEDGMDSPDVEDASAKKPEKSRKKLLVLIPIALIAFALIFAGGVLHPKITGGDKALGAAGTALNSIDVIQVTRDFIPGDTITENDIQKATISAEAYNQISLSGATLYQWSRSDSLIDAYAANFIPKGQYLTYENVDSAYHQAVNPWTSDAEDAAYITLPLTTEQIQSDSVGYGSILDLTITRTTVNSTAAESQDGRALEQQVPGLEHQGTVEQSSLVDTYNLPGVVVCDLMNTDRNSLYSTYTTWISIPAGERAIYLKERLNEDSSLGSSMLPAYVQVCVTKAQADALGDLTSPDVSIEVNVTDNTDTSSDAKSIFAAEAQALIENIRSVMQESAETTQTQE